MNKSKHRKKTSKQSKLNINSVKTLFIAPYFMLLRWARRNLLNKLLLVLAIIVLLLVAIKYGIARWYMAEHADRPLIIGATFIPDYAAYFGMDPVEVMDAMIHDLDIKHLRLVSYWSNGERIRDQYDFTFLDWQMDKAKENNVKVSLAIGLRQPRWPECHMPAWAEKMPMSQWRPELYEYIQKVVERYRDHPALESWQLENEFFMEVFGICPDHTRDRLVEQYNLVKSLDDSRPLIVSRSNNALGWPIGQPKADMTALTVYKRVWDKNLTRRYFEYPIPAWYYGFLAGINQIWNGTDTFVHELQAEAWLPDGFNMRTAPIEELYKSMNPERLEHRIHYGVDTGMKRIDLWGVEWWYFMKEHRGAPELWQTAKETLKEVRAVN